MGKLAEIFPTELISPSRDSVLYMTFTSPLLSPGPATGVFDLYEARRSAQGWHTTRRVTPSGDLSAEPFPGGSTPEHSYAFIDSEVGGTLTSETTRDYLSNPDGTYELTGQGSLGTEGLSQGRYISPGGEQIIFTTGLAGMDGSDAAQSVFCAARKFVCKVLQLEPDAPPTGTGAIYDRSADGPTHVVSLLPGDVTPAAGAQAFYKGTSKDASSVAFVIEGTLYVRADNGLASERTEEVASGELAFAGLSDDGRYLFYVAGGDKGTIHRFDTTDETDVAVNPSAEGEVANVSADGSHVYFICEEEIGGEGEAGKPNLFAWSGTAPEYVATVAPVDLVETPGLTRWTEWVTNAAQMGAEPGPGADSSRTTPDGHVVVFESRASLTGYPNAEHTEIYRYDATAKTLRCVSCNPSGAVAEHDARLQQLDLMSAAVVVHNVSNDGSRVFFETSEPLVGRDADGINDIYEWQEDEGTPTVSLISSGETTEYLPPGSGANGEGLGNIPHPNALLSISPEGEDVVFLSQDLLVPGAGAGEGGVPALYDARVGGGFPQPGLPSSCSQGSCHGIGGGSADALVQGASSETASGAGNLKPRKHRCQRGKTKQHGRCKHRKRHSKKKSREAAGPSARVSSTATPAPSQDSGPVDAGGHSSEQSIAASPGQANAPTTRATNTKPYGIESVEAQLSDPKAGGHPDFRTRLVVNQYRNSSGVVEASGNTEGVSVSLPPGLIGSINATRRCDAGQLLAFGNCPLDTQVGLVHVDAAGDFQAATTPLFNLVPPHPRQEVARFGFWAYLYPVFIDVKVRTAGDYGVTASAHSSPGLIPLLEAETTLWGTPSDPSHDTERITAVEQGCLGIICMGGETERGVPRTGLAFMTNPSACQQNEVGFELRSYRLPTQVFTATTPLNPITDCNGLPFAPTLSAQPTSHVASAPTGLQTKLVLPQHLRGDERATATMREARVTLPVGMQIAAGAANWIGTCSDDQVGFHHEVDTACPDNSKLGTAAIVSPDLPEPIEGTIYQRSPQPGHQFGLWLTSDALGLHIKLPGELEPDQHTGRLTAVFRDLPQVPVEEIDLNVWGGDRAPLQNPDSCGTYTSDFSFSPHSSDPAATGQDTMQITEGCNQPFSPILKAGVTEPTAGKFSPFVFDLIREDGNQALRGFELKLPAGELAKLKGVPLCSDADAAAGNCPGDSRIGSLSATTGPGPEPLSVPQPGKPQPQIYLAGPYQGAPFSIVSEVPAQAGPFDLGVLAVRSGLDVEPETGRAVVKADPLPQFFEGIGIAYRHLHAVIDRPSFSLNPTDCRAMAVNADVTSTQGAVAHPQARFKVDGCKALKFKPRLSLKLRGGTKRTQYPALTATLRARKGDANVAFASVAMPHSEFLAQEHIGTICTRKQFVVDKCPRGSVYGKAKAWTPLLDKPLAGPVYLRSSDHPLPDLVAKLAGQLEIDLVGRIDSVHGGIRTTFESVPDAPVSRFVLRMKGGAKGLLTNSTDICRGKHRASVAMRAQNGRAWRAQPSLLVESCTR